MKKRLCACMLAALLGCGVLSAGLHAFGDGHKERVQPQTDQALLSPAQAQGTKLREKMLNVQEAEQVDSFYMDTPDGAYAFIRTDGGVNLDGKTADTGSFERMLELLLGMPVQEQEADGQTAEDVLAITLRCVDGAQECVAITITGEDAWMLLDSGEQVRTDAWRIHTLMLACDGARLE